LKNDIVLAPKMAVKLGLMATATPQNIARSCQVMSNASLQTLPPPAKLAGLPLAVFALRCGSRPVFLPYRFGFVQLFFIGMITAQVRSKGTRACLANSINILNLTPRP